MADPPVASVIVAVYQQPFSARLLLMSLAAQKDAPPFEVIVCDDGSSPAVFEACRPIIEQSSVPMYWLWQQDRGHRVAASRNNGIRQARGTYLLFLDGDMVPEEDHIARHVAAHSHPKQIIVGNRLWRNIALAQALPLDRAADALAGLRGDGAIDETSAALEERERKIRRRRFKQGSGWCVAATCNLSVDRLPEVLFDEGFQGYGGEDSELAYRLVRLQGYEIKSVRDLPAYHVQATASDPTMTGSHDSIVAAVRNVVYFADKWPEAQEEYGYYPLRRLQLDRQSNTWSMRTTPAEKAEIPALLAQAREWLVLHGA